MPRLRRYVPDVLNSIRCSKGTEEFKEEGSKFVKNFVDIDIKPEGIIPTVGSMQACFAAFMAVTECKKEKTPFFSLIRDSPYRKHRCK